MGGAADRRRQGVGDRPKKRLKAFHRALAGRGDVPEEWLLSLICQEFGCPPDVAVRQPLQLTMRIIELRQYARTKMAVDAAQTEAQMPRGPMADLVFEVEHELIKERQARMQARADRKREEV